MGKYSGWVAAALVLIVALFFYDRMDNVVTQYVQTIITKNEAPNPSRRVLDGLLNELQAPVTPFRACLGYNANLDQRVNLVELLNALSVTPPSPSSSNAEEGKKVAGQPFPHNQIATEADLAETAAYFFSKGSAAERFVSDPALFDRIVKAAASIKDSVFSTGGNAALMAERFAKEGCQPLLGGATGTHLSQLLHPSVATAKSSEGVQADEVHLILEYSTGATWGSFTSPRANRFILVHDMTNSQLTTLETFHAAAADYNCQLVVIAGLHLLEGQPEEVRTQRLQAVVEAIHRVPKNIPIHLELASVGDLSFLRTLIDSVLTEVDSVGLNEQELGALYVALKGDTSDVSLFVAPDVEIVATAMEYAFNYTQHKKQEAKHQNSRLMSRMHFHFLNYHVVGTRDCAHNNNHNNNTFFCWLHGKSSVVAGSVVSARQACDNDNIQLDKVELRMKKQNFEFVENKKVVKVVVDPVEGDVVTKWVKNDVVYHLAPVLVCKNPTKTVGLGDAISTMGLVYDVGYSIQQQPQQLSQPTTLHM